MAAVAAACCATLATAYVGTAIWHPTASIKARPTAALRALPGPTARPPPTRELYDRRCCAWLDVKRETRHRRDPGFRRGHRSDEALQRVLAEAPRETRLGPHVQYREKHFCVLVARPARAWAATASATGGVV
eukprot:1954225-Pyramimonas_sp.AAC.1